MAIITHLVFEYDDDSSWSTLRSRLKLLVRGWVYSSHIPCWQGQEEEIVDDIVSESSYSSSWHTKSAISLRSSLRPF